MFSSLLTECRYQNADTKPTLSLLVVLVVLLVVVLVVGVAVVVVGVAVVVVGVE